MAINPIRRHLSEALRDAAGMMQEVGAACILVRWRTPTFPEFAARPTPDLWEGDDSQGWETLWTLTPGLAPDPRESGDSMPESDEVLRLREAAHRNLRGLTA